MPPCALIQRTERLLQQANHMLHQMLSIQTLASLTRQLSTLHRLVEEYGLRLPIGGLAALQVQPELHAAEVTDAIRHLTDTAPRSVESQYISQMPQTSFGSMDRAQQIAVQDAFHPRDAMPPAVGDLLFRLQNRSLEANHQLEAKAGSESQRLTLYAHLEPSSAAPTARPKPRVQDATEAVGNDVEHAHLRVSPGHAKGARHPLPRRTVLPVANITRVQASSPAMSLQTAGMMQGETQRGGLAPRRIQAQPIITPATRLAPRSPAPPELTAQSDAMAATDLSLKLHTSKTAPTTGVLAHQPASNQQSGLSPRHWRAGVTEPRHSHWPSPPQQPPPALDRSALSQSAGALEQELVAPQWWLEDVDREHASNIDPDAFATLVAPEEDVQRLADQLERLLRDEARRHGIDL